MLHQTTETRAERGRRLLNEIDGAAGEAGPSPGGDHRDAVLAAELQEGGHLLGGAREGYAHWLWRIDASPVLAVALENFVSFIEDVAPQRLD